MVLALFLLELHNGLHKGCSVFSIAVDIFKFGEAEKTQECLKYKTKILMKLACIISPFLLIVDRN